MGRVNPDRLSFWILHTRAAPRVRPGSRRPPATDWCRTCACTRSNWRCRTRSSCCTSWSWSCRTTNCRGSTRSWTPPGSRSTPWWPTAPVSWNGMCGSWPRRPGPGPTRRRPCAWPTRSWSARRTACRPRTPTFSRRPSANGASASCPAKTSCWPGSSPRSTRRRPGTTRCWWLASPGWARKRWSGPSTCAAPAGTAPW